MGTQREPKKTPTQIIESALEHYVRYYADYCALDAERVLEKIKSGQLIIVEPSTKAD